MQLTLNFENDFNTCFKEIYYSLYSNSSASRAESIISDITKILLFKLISEQDPNISLNDCSGSYIMEVLSSTIPERYSVNEKMNLSDSLINEIISKIKTINLSQAPSHIIGDAFQTIIGPKIRGDKGQFFTPKELVECMVSIIRPKSDELIIDPACGTGGFLSEAVSQISNTNLRNSLRLIGIDKDRDMADIAFATTKIIAGNNTRIINTNSLEVLKKENEFSSYIGQADIILTNPPFGSKIGITDESILKLYDFGHNWTLSSSDNAWYMLNSLVKEQAPQILFLELCIKLLKKGGKMGIVLPEGMFGNKSLGYIWNYLKKNGDILAMIDCPRNTFQPSTDTKTNVLFFEKGTPFRDSVLISVAKNCGHDKRGKSFTQNNEPWPNDFKLLSEDYYSSNRKLWKTVSLSGQYCVPRYLFGKTEHIGDNQYISIGELIKKGYLVKKTSKEIGSEAYGTGNIPFVRTSDINNYEISTDPTNSVSEEIFEQYKRQQNLEIGDILLIVDGRYRIGKTAIITQYNIKCLIQSHIEILSLRKGSPYSPYEFLYCLNSAEVQSQIRNMVFIQSTLGTLGSRLNEIFIPLPESTTEWKNKIKDFQELIETRAECLFKLKESEHSFDL